MGFEDDEKVAALISNKIKENIQTMNLYFVMEAIEIKIIFRKWL